MCFFFFTKPETTAELLQESIWCQNKTQFGCFFNACQIWQHFQILTAVEMGVHGCWVKKSLFMPNSQTTGRHLHHKHLWRSEIPTVTFELWTPNCLSSTQISSRLWKVRRSIKNTDALRWLEITPRSSFCFLSLPMGHQGSRDGVRGPHPQRKIHFCFFYAPPLM